MSKQEIVRADAVQKRASAAREANRRRAKAEARKNTRPEREAERVRAIELTALGQAARNEMRDANLRDSLPFQTVGVASGTSGLPDDGDDDDGDE